MGLTKVPADIIVNPNKDFAFNGVPLSKNVIINGNMDIWQRGTSFVGPANLDYTADRFKYGKTGTMVQDITRSADVPTVAESSAHSVYSLFSNVTTAQGSIGVNDLSYIEYDVEGYDFRLLSADKFTLSFWAKASKIGTYCVAFLNNGTNKSWVSEYTINVADTWEKKTVVVDAAPIGVGTWDFINGIGLRIYWTIAKGSAIQASSANTWLTGAFIGTANQVNGVDTINNELRISQIQLEPGDKTSTFITRHIKDELALCQRYFEKSYDMNVDPGSITNDGTLANRTSGSTTTPIISVPFRIIKRAIPSVSLYNPTNGIISELRDRSTSSNKTVSSINDIGENGFSNITTGTTLSDTIWFEFHYTADAEL